MSTFDRIKLVIGAAFLGAVFGELVGSLIGYQQVVSQIQQCYTHDVIDRTFEHWTTAIAAFAGLIYVVNDWFRSKVDPDYMK